MPTHKDLFAQRCAHDVIRSVSKKTITTTICDAGLVKHHFVISAVRKLREQLPSILELQAHVRSIQMTDAYAVYETGQGWILTNKKLVKISREKKICRLRLELDLQVKSFGAFGNLSGQKPH